MALPYPPASTGGGNETQQLAWDAAWLECGLLFGLAIVLRSLPLSLPSALQTPVNLLLALAPALFWLGYSELRSAYRPPVRRAAIGCMLISGLVGNALSLPLIEEVYEVRRWLPLESAINRIIGYSFTVGLTQALTLWLVVRHAVPRRDLLTRVDLLVYCRAAAVGYTVVTCLDFALAVRPLPAAQAFQVFNTAAALNCVAIILAYGLAELYFRRELFLLLPMLTASLAALVSGSAIPLVAGFNSAAILALEPFAAVSPLIGSLYSLGLLLTVWAVVRFLFTNAGAGTNAVTRADDAS